MEQDNHTEKRTQMWAWAVVFVAVVVGGIMYFQYSGTNQDRQDATGGGEIVDPVVGSEVFQEATAQAQTDIAGAAEKLKALAANENADAYYRAQAAGFLAEQALIQDTATARNVIFTGDWWGTFLQDSGDIEEAARRAFEYSLEIAPTTLAHNRIALWYLGEAMDGQDTAENRAAAEENIDAAEEVFQMRRDAGDMSVFAARGYYSLSGLANHLAYIQWDEQERRDVAEARYRNALHIDSMSGAGLYARFNLADLLRRAEGEGARTEIAGLLSPIIALYDINPNISIFGYFASRSSDAFDGEYSKSQMQEMAVFHSPFAELLRTLGWKETDITGAAG